MSKMHFSLFSISCSFKCFTHFSIELSVFLVICMSLRMHLEYFWHLSSDFSHTIVCVCVYSFSSFCMASGFFCHRKGFLILRFFSLLFIPVLLRSLHFLHINFNPFSICPYASCETWVVTLFFPDGYPDVAIPFVKSHIFPPLIIFIRILLNIIASLLSLC